MRKLLSILLTLTIVLSTCISTSASEMDSTCRTRIVENNGYSFSITEKIDDKNQIIRTYEKQQSRTKKATSLDETKSLLVTLGMEEENVDNLSQETLQEFAEGTQIVISTSYTKTDENNNVTYLDEDTALKEAGELKSQQDALIYNKAQGLATAASERDTYKDSYMKITYAITYKGNGSYLHSIDSKWLTMPFFRGTDSIGACAMNSTVTNYTRSGNFSYDITTITNGIFTYAKMSGEIEEFENAINGNWYGSAGLVSLPSDVEKGNVSVIYDNFQAHYQYQGHVNLTETSSWFNTVASYDHATIGISLTSPSVSIDLNGEVSASIGLDIFGKTDTRSIEFEIYYSPD